MSRDIKHFKNCIASIDINGNLTPYPNAPKATFATEEYNWQKIGDCDYICYMPPYDLRVEKMDENMWWWRAYYKGSAISYPRTEFTGSKYRAIGLCEGIQMAHKALNNK